MDTTEVTVEAHKACSDRGGSASAPTENEWDGIDDKSHKLYDPLCNIRDPEAKAKHPINCVDWELADVLQGERQAAPTGSRVGVRDAWPGRSQVSMG